MKVREIAKKYGLDPIEFENYLRYRETNQEDIQFGFIGLSVDNNIEEYVNRYKQYEKDEEAKIKAKAEEKERQRIAEEEEKERQRVAEEEEKERQRIAEEEKRQALAKMLITSGFSFDGYKITKYSGYISGDDAISIARGTSGLFSSATNVSQSLCNSLVKIRRQAIQELKEAAYDLGCNAVIGVDFDYITLEPETATSTGGTMYLPYVFCVTANGNAVIIEKDE